MKYLPRRKDAAFLPLPTGQLPRPLAKHVNAWQRVLKRPLVAIPLITAGALSVVTLAIFATFHFTGAHSALRPTDSHIILLAHDDKKETLPSTAGTVGELLKRADIRLANGDRVEPSADTRIVEDNFHINVYRALPVTIVDGDKEITALSAATTPRSLARQAGVKTFPEDELTVRPTDNFVTEGALGQRIIIKRAVPVNVILYGTPTVLRTHAKTVGDLLKERHIRLAKDDTVQPAAKTKLSSNSQIFIVRKGIQIAAKEEIIPMPSETIEDNSLSFGSTAIRQQGAPGKKLITYEVQLQNGKEVGRKPIQEIVTQQPVKQIIARGKAVQIPGDITAVMAQAGIAPGDYAYVNYIVSHEGGWCPTKVQGQAGYCPPYAPVPFPTSGGYGICQATPGSKMSSAGGDWQTNVVTQLRWCSGYASRYGGWGGAYNFWLSHHWW